MDLDIISIDKSKQSAITFSFKDGCFFSLEDAGQENLTIEVSTGLVVTCKHGETVSVNILSSSKLLNSISEENGS